MEVEWNGEEMYMNIGYCGTNKEYGISVNAFSPKYSYLTLNVVNQTITSSHCKKGDKGKLFMLSSVWVCLGLT